MILPDHQIEFDRRLGLLDIAPWNPDRLQPASYDLTLGSMARDDEDEEWPFCHLSIQQGSFWLLHTAEVVTLSAGIGAQVVGKSSWARRGLIVESAGWVDPGFTGQLVLEVTNLSPRPVKLEPGVSIAQIIFFELKGPSKNPYGSQRGSHYQGQMGATPAWS